MFVNRWKNKELYCQGYTELGSIVEEGARLQRERTRSSGLKKNCALRFNILFDHLLWKCLKIMQKQMAYPLSSCVLQNNRMGTEWKGAILPLISARVLCKSHPASLCPEMFHVAHLCSFFLNATLYLFSTNPPPPFRFIPDFNSCSVKEKVLVSLPTILLMTFLLCPFILASSSDSNSTTLSRPF